MAGPDNGSNSFVTPVTTHTRAGLGNPDGDTSTPASDLGLGLGLGANLLDNAAGEGSATPCLSLGGPAPRVTSEVRRHSTEKAMLEATLTNLRSKVSDIEKDEWMYEGPRYTYS
jgi:hypothetical protein